MHGASYHGHVTYGRMHDVVALVIQLPYLALHYVSVTVLVLSSVLLGYD